MQQTVYMIERVDLSYLGCRQLKDQILSGELKRGQKLVQKKFAKKMGIRRIPFHNTLQMLEGEFFGQKFR
jgi:DNA-binding GntR family transcriptional regulator